MTPQEACIYADKYGPSEETREIACKEPFSAYLYADTIDQKSRDDTRNAACEDPEWIYWYAVDVDKYPRDDTRNAACKDPEYAYEYAKYVDKGFHEDTWLAVKGTEYEKEYKKAFNNSIKELII